MNQTHALFHGVDVLWISRPSGIRHDYMQCQLRRHVPKALHIAAQNRSVVIQGQHVWSGKTGCLRAHVTALRAAHRTMRATGNPVALVFEDDVSIERGVDVVRRPLRALVAGLPADWDVVQLGYHAHAMTWNHILQSRQLLARKRPGEHIWALLAYLVSRKAAEAVWNATHVDARGMVHVHHPCGRSADDCVMNGKIVGRPWRAWYATPPVFWEPMHPASSNRSTPAVLLRTTVNSNSPVHAFSSVMGSSWATRHFGPAATSTREYACEAAAVARLRRRGVRSRGLATERR